MSTASLKSPLAFTPVFKDKIWGGQAMRTNLGRDIAQGAAIGESWDVAGFGNEVTRISDGPHAGKTLLDLIATNREELLGRAAAFDFFPLLYKFIDANDKLSIQVHPDDEQARANGWGVLGKTECWYIVDTKPDAKIIVGFKEGVTQEHVVHGVRNNALPEILNYIDICAGDVLFIPAGTVHAILDGTLLYEVQESSDTTFRLYDWGRVDANGVSRPLHVEQSLHVLDYTHHNRHKIHPIEAKDFLHGVHTYRVASRYFVLEELICESDGQYEIPNRPAFHVITNTGETVDIASEEGTVRLVKGGSCLVPAACNNTAIWCTTGARLLISYIPDLAADVVEPLRKQGTTDKEIELLGGNPARNDLAGNMHSH